VIPLPLAGTGITRSTRGMYRLCPGYAGLPFFKKGNKSHITKKKNKEGYINLFNTKYDIFIFFEADYFRF
jgi:hypothetical protein